MEMEDEFEKLSLDVAYQLEPVRIYFIDDEEKDISDDSISDSSSSSSSSDSSDSSDSDEGENKEQKKKRKKKKKELRKALRKEKKEWKKKMKHKKEQLKKKNAWSKEKKEEWKKEMFDKKHAWKKKWKERMGWKERHKFCLEVHGNLEKMNKTKIVIAKEAGSNEFNQKFVLKQNRIILASEDNYCLTVLGEIESGAKLGMREISDEQSDKQKWKIEEGSQSTKILLQSNQSFCVQAKNPRHKAKLFLAQTGEDEALQKFQLETLETKSRGQNKLEQAIKLMEEAGEEQEFEDPEFVASPESVGELLEHKTEWKRAKEFLGHDYKLFDAISPNDIIQGALGDCWLLSSLSVLAEKPHRVESLFPKKHKNFWGLWGVKLFLDGVETQVTADDKFPVFKNSSTPCFSRNKGKELWVMLVEKVYAKLHGSYAAIEGGAPGDALSDLTGAPYETFRNNKHDPEDLWKKLMNAEKEGYLMCCAVPVREDVDLEKLKGLVEGHAFSVLDIRETSNNARVMKIRNPWGSMEWNGDWSDAWSGWTDELKQELSYENKDDGIFWISYKDFLTYFSYITIVYVRDNWHHSSHQTILRKKTSCYSLKVNQSTKLRVSFHQKRGTPLVHNRLAVVDSEQQPVGGTSEVLSSAEVNSTREMSLEPGTYYVVVDTYSGDAKKMPVKATLSAYSDHPVTISSSLKTDVPFVLPEYITKFGLCDTCHKVLSATSISAVGQKFHPECFKCHKCKSRLGGSFYVLDSNPICPSCAKGPTVTCSGCNKPIDAQCFTVLGGKWHPDCFKCYSCKLPVKGQFYALGSHPICATCAKTKYKK